MCPKFACIIRFKITLVAFVRFLCVFFNASLNDSHKKMNIHIDCICEICLKSEFSYVSSKFLPVQMQSHIAFAFVCFLVLFFFFIEGRTFQRKKFSCWWQFINCFSLSLTIRHPWQLLFLLSSQYWREIMMERKDAFVISIIPIRSAIKPIKCILTSVILLLIIIFR